MTTKERNAVSTALRDEMHERLVSFPIGQGSPQFRSQITALDSAIAHFTALEAATGEEAKEHVGALNEVAMLWQEPVLENTVDMKYRKAVVAGAAAITALAASKAKVANMAEALKKITRIDEVVYTSELRDIARAALKEVGHE